MPPIGFIQDDLDFHLDQIFVTVPPDGRGEAALADSAVAPSFLCRPKEVQNEA